MCNTFIVIVILEVPTRRLEVGDVNDSGKNSRCVVTIENHMSASSRSDRGGVVARCARPTPSLFERRSNVQFALEYSLFHGSESRLRKNVTDAQYTHTSREAR